MRRLVPFCITSLLILCIGSVCTQAEAVGDADLSGDWKIEYSFGGAQIAEQAVIINEDYTFGVMDEDESSSGSWGFDGETLTLSNEGEEIALKWDANSQQLTGEYGGMNVTMSRSDETMEGSDSDLLAGGWTVADDPEITDEIDNKFQLALDDYQTGMITISYTPAAYLGSQVAAGTNYAILCKANEINKGSKWVIVYFGEDPEENLSVVDIADVDWGM